MVDAPELEKEIETVPIEQRPELLMEAHDSIMGGHGGEKKTLAKLKSHGHVWRGMTRDIRRYVRNCKTCQKTKRLTGKQRGQTQPLDIATYPFESVAMDFVTGFPEVDGATGVLTVIDRFSKYTILIPTFGLYTAEYTAELLFKHVVV